ncbi:MAG TPA: hypothetical protein VHN98_12855 [Acidimicrobiales bacterium]|nr:hypothetical protein [Acidimicrobiales bacterium]
MQRTRAVVLTAIALFVGVLMTATPAGAANEPTLQVNAPSAVWEGAPPVQFTGTVSNPQDGQSYTNVRIDFSLTGVDGLKASDITLEYQTGTTWAPVPLSDQPDGSITGSFGPSTGFPLPAGASNTTNFRVAVRAGAPEGDLTITSKLNQVDPGTGAVQATLATDTDMTSIKPQATAGNGYREVAADGGIFTFGNRGFYGSTGDMKLNKPIVGGATDVSTYNGYWMVASDGGVFNFNAPFYGSLGDKQLSSPAVEIEPTPTGNGYWIVQADGTVTPFGGAESYGDMRGKGLNKPVIGMSVAPDGKGYWLVAQDGGIFNFGSAQFLGSMGDQHLNAPVIDLAPTPDGQGYYLVAKDGGVFTFGSAEFKGSTGDMTLNKPVVAMLVAPNGAGYWLGASDGGIFTFGAPAVDFLGSMGGTPLNAPVLDLIN